MKARKRGHSSSLPPRPGIGNRAGLRRGRQRPGDPDGLPATLYLYAMNLGGVSDMPAGLSSSDDAQVDGIKLDARLIVLLDWILVRRQDSFELSNLGPI